MTSDRYYPAGFPTSIPEYTMIILTTFNDDLGDFTGTNSRLYQVASKTDRKPITPASKKLEECETCFIESNLQLNDLCKMFYNVSFGHHPKLFSL